jgi:serine/threonine protein kinase
MEELGSVLGRFVGGLSNVDELRTTFRNYLQRHPEQREAVARWLAEGVEVGRVTPAVMVSLADLLATPRDQAATVRTAGANHTAVNIPIPDGLLRIGSVLDNRYTLIEELGGGGMGTVYKVRDRNREDFRDRQPFVALKVLGEEFKRHPDARLALQRETARAQSLAHPNIITVYDFDYDGPHAYMTMELLQGQPLDAFMQSKEFATTSLLRRWQMVRSIGAGLAYAHEKGVVHSDLKPGNIFLCDNGTMKVMDFGIARPLRSVVAGKITEITVFDPAERIGGLTPAYASLEQWNREPPDPRDDIYAFACVVYGLFSGKHPFGRASAKGAFAARMVPPRIDGLSRRQWEALRRGLAFERRDRLGSIDEFLRLFAPQTKLQKYRWWIAGGAVTALTLLLYVGAISYRAYAQDQAVNDTLWPPPAGSASQPLNVDQQREVEDVLYLASQSLEQARHTHTIDEFTSIMSTGANNVHEMLLTVRTLDPGNAHALRLTGEAAQAYADFARARLAADEPTNAWKLVLAGQKFEHTRSLLRLRQEICSRSPPTCQS